MGVGAREAGSSLRSEWKKEKQRQEQRQRPRGLVVEKIRSVWDGGDPRGPSASPQDDTLLKKVAEARAKQSKAKAKATATATANAGILHSVQNDGVGGVGGDGGELGWKSNSHVVWWWKRSVLYGTVETLGVLRLRLRMTPF
jgi:hypothetical protein